MRKRHLVFAALAAYAAAGYFATPKIRHSWWYLQENVNRRFSTFCALSAVSCAFPWCIPAGMEAYRNISSRGAPSRIDPKLFALALGAEGQMEHVDARVMTISGFKARLEDFAKSHGGCRVWCFGRFDYCLTPAINVDFGQLLSLFADEDAFGRFASARIYSPAALFSCYVGDYSSIAPALVDVPAHGRLMSAITSPRVLFRPEGEGALAPVRVARFTPFDVKFPRWIERGAADAKMFLDFEDGYETAQEARREALIGFDFADRGMPTNAIACWARAAKANPRDPLLLELADALDSEARAHLNLGNVNGALHCYENRILIFPGDAAAVHNFGICLKRAGHRRLAEQVLATAERSETRRGEDNTPSRYLK